MELQRCQKYCLTTTGCTAIRFNDKHKGHFGCVLQQCKLPVPEPTVANRKYVGYSTTAGIDSGRN